MRGGDLDENQPPLAILARPAAGCGEQALLLRGEESGFVFKRLVKRHRALDPAAVTCAGVRERPRFPDEFFRRGAIREPGCDGELHEAQVEVLRLLRHAFGERRARFGEHLLLEKKLDHIEQVFRLGVVGKFLREKFARLVLAPDREPRLGEFAAHIEPARCERNRASEKFRGVRVQRGAAEETREFQDLREPRRPIEFRGQRIEDRERLAPASEHEKRSRVREREILAVGRGAQAFGEKCFAPALVAQQVEKFERGLLDFFGSREPPRGIEQHVERLAAKLEGGEQLREFQHRRFVSRRGFQSPAR